MHELPGPRFMATLASITLIGPLSIHAFLPVMPVVKSVFGISDALVGLMFSLTLFAMAFSTLVYGTLSDRYGRRPVLLTGLALFVIGSGVAAIAPSVSSLVAGRIVQALGAGCGVGLARAIARDAYGTEGLVKVIAYLTMAYTLGPMIAPLAGGMLLDSSGWRSVFWFATIAGALITAAVYGVLYETHPRAETRQEAPGFLRDYAQLFAHARFTAFVLQSGFSSATFFAMGAAAAFLMKDYLGRSATEFGAYFLLFPIGFLLGNLTSSRLAHRIGIETMVLAGSLLNLIAAALQAVAILAGHVTPLVLFVPGFLTTFGQGIALPNAQVGALRVVPSLSGTAAGLGVFFQMFLGAAFAQLYSVLSDGTPNPLVITVGLASILTLAAGAVPFVLKHRAVAARS